MPSFRVYTPEEVATMQNRRGRSVDLNPYLDHLRDLAIGQMGEAGLGNGEKKATVKRRLTAAAKQLGKPLRYRRSGDDKIVYEISSK